MEAAAMEAGAGRKLAARHPHGRSRTAHNMSSSSLRKKSDAALVRKVPVEPLRPLLANLQEVFLATKLAVLFPAVPLAIAAQCFRFGQVWVFALSLLGLIPLAERVSFLTEQIALYTGPTVGGLLNATCGNATELIIALFALVKGKMEVVKCSLLGSVLSNLLLVLGTSLFCGGVVNLGAHQPYDRKQSDVSTGLLLLGVLCHSMPLLLRYAVAAGEHSVLPVSAGDSTLALSRACSFVMLASYVAYLFFQLKTHRQLFEPQDVVDGDGGGGDGAGEADEEPALGFASAAFWLVAMTVVISVLSEYVVGTIEPTSESWGLSVSFISVILLPIVGNAAEHAGAIIFALKNKLDITLGVALGSATQISMFVVPLSVLVAWIMGVQMDLDFKLLETGSLFIAVLVTAFTLQDGASHYLKGVLLLLCYIVIGACFFVARQPAGHANSNGSLLDVPTSSMSVQVA
uniref:Vacuolar cation/proton exchanger n=1 Tax=Leersia perrieri TaxID=77586 RepID=A0A0D9V200_9ORYZ